MNEAVRRESIERGVAAHQAGQLEQALAHYRIALDAAQGDAEAISLSGLALLGLGRHDEAMPLLLRAVEQEPRQAGFRLNLAEGLQRTGQHERALREAQTVLTTSPDNARARALGCEASVASGNWPALQAMAAHWLGRYPNSPDAWRAAARAAFEQGRHVEAANAFSRLLALSTPGAADLAAYGSLCLHALDYAGADAALARAEALDPENAQMLAARALLHMYFGRFADAQSYCRRCLARDPENVSAYSTLSRLRRGQLSDADRDATTRMAQRTDLHPDIRIPAAFIAAHADDARGDIDAAMASYERAHELARQRDALEGRGYDPRLVEQRMQRLQELASRALPEPASPGAPRSLFIVGMPRSGTTLVEGVLAAHSRVLGMGERPMMPQIQRAFLALDAAGKFPDAATVQAWRAAYFRDVPSAMAEDHFTDKLPLNFESAGLIAQLLPAAVIVHVRRDPVETCLSIYRQEFNKHWAFAHRFADIAHYYGCYARLVAHWEATLGPRFATLRYEDLVADFESLAPRLLRACGLDWEPQCANFQEAPRPIATFSTVQARDPVRSGNGRARRYEKHMGPLIEALQREGVP